MSQSISYHQKNSRPSAFAFVIQQRLLHSDGAFQAPGLSKSFIGMALGKRRHVGASNFPTIP
jgi:hypothetical protein